MKRACPYCGVPLPEEASFCPHCAQTVRKPDRKKVPRPLRRRAVLVGLMLILVLAAASGVYAVRRPQVYDGVGEVFYTRDGVDYQILVAWPNNRCQPAPDIYQSGKAGELGRWPSRLYVNYRDTGADAWEQFLLDVQKYIETYGTQEPEGLS